MTKLVSFLFAALLGSTLGFSLLNSDDNKKIEPDNITYADPMVVDLETPFKAGDDTEEGIFAHKITMHYRNEDAKCGEREFYVWTKTATAYSLKPEVSPDGKEMMVVIDYSEDKFKPYASESYIYFIIKFKGTWNGQSEDILVPFDKYTPDENGHLEIWTIPGEGTSVEIYMSEEETKFDKITSAKFTDWKTISCESTIVASSYALYAFDSSYFDKAATEKEYDKEFYLLKTGIPTETSFEIKLNYTAHINVRYVVESIFATKPTLTQSINVGMENLYADSRFEQYYTYDGSDLGATYTKEATTFKVWAPTSAALYLNVYNTGTPKNLKIADISASNFCKTYRMGYQPGGIWQVTVEGDLSGKYYTYDVYNASGDSEVVDPYAKACGVNGLRGMIIDFDTTDPEGWDNIPQVWDQDPTFDIVSPQELAIYEIHVRDLTSDETWQGNSRRGTYSAFSEAGTTYTGKDSSENDVTVKTGFDHIEEMNVNAIQILPVFDHDDNETLALDENNNLNVSEMMFNWGYNPLNYNCIEGGYATDPYDGASRINEFKTMVMNYANNANNTRCIMDVVYNHVSSASNSNWTHLVPKYYYRYDAEWNYYAGSGCANEIKTEAKMVRKFIVESVCWWAKEFKIKGFRFDLMGLIDTETMRAVKEALYAIDPDICIYGEGWTALGYNGELGTHGTFTENAYSELYHSEESPGQVGAFNDNGRNAIKGENWLPSGSFYGYIANGNNVYGVQEMLLGRHPGKGGNPAQTLTYASCHDNYTLFDQLTYTIGNDGQNYYAPGIICSAVAAVEATILSSNGVAFIQGGEEIFRTKEITLDEDKDRIFTEDAEGNTYYKDTDMINGKMISHNSYNLSDSVNSFKWDRKIKIEMNGNTADTLSYCLSIANAAKARQSMTIYSYNDFEEWDRNAVANHERPMNSWTNSAGNTLGFRRDNFYLLLNATCDESFGFEAISKCQDLFCTNPGATAYIRQQNAVKLGWATAVGLLYQA